MDPKSILGSRVWFSGWRLDEDAKLCVPATHYGVVREFRGDNVVVYVPPGSDAYQYDAATYYVHRDNVFNKHEEDAASVRSLQLAVAANEERALKQKRRSSLAAIEARKRGEHHVAARILNGRRRA